MTPSESQIHTRLQSIEDRLSKIESELNIPESKPWLEEPQPDLSHTSLLKTDVKPGNLLGIIAVICFVLAAGFIIKLSIESGWLTPARQVGLAVLFGLSLIGSGLALWHTDREYASLLPAAGVIVLYSAIFAAHRFYFLISFEIALALISVTSGICILLYLKFKYQLYALTAAIGAYTTPILFGFNTTSVFTLYYFIFCSLAFSTISIWIQSRTLTLISAYLAILFTAMIGDHLYFHQYFIVAALAINFIIFSLGTYFYSKQIQSLTKNEAWSFFPILMIFYATEYYFINIINSHIAPWISLIFAGFILILYQLAKRWSPDHSLNSQPMIFSFITLICFHSIYLELLPLTIRPWLFVLIVIGFAFFPANYFKKQSKNEYVIPIIALITIVAIEYINMIFNLINEWNITWLTVSFASFVSIWFAVICKKNTITNRYDFDYIILSSAHLLGITALYQLTTQYGSLAVSASWLLYAIGVILFAFSRKDKVMANSALFILAFATGKVLLYDVSSAQTSIRIFCLLLTGLVLYGSGFLMRKIAAWKE